MVKRGPTLNLFLDSSVLFTAVNSPTGGSSKLFTLPNIRLFVSKVVLHEVEKNVRNKLMNYHLNRFFMLVAKLDIILSNPSENLIKQAKKVIVEKDAVILAEAKKSKCDYIITLDKKDFLQEKVFKFIKPKRILTPKMFFEMLK
ncbi:MAG: type II toxin-antitoxin system VapC family toxin [bacterium]